ncbi:unnamed protein product [Brassica napus]|uniref:(rape) hypothetical protein n=1 Tax=Brassica napus TaxID=3708 RepID=A0A816TEM5_BRANA|nr:unnamed protein product [Brassica napus]
MRRFLRVESARFLEVNDIGRTHSLYYRDYGLHMEYKGKVKTANEIFNLGISRNAKPVEKLNDAYKKFMVRTMRRTKTVDDIRSFFYMFIYA